MTYLIWSLVAVLPVLVGLVMVPVWTDRPWEHEGATAGWSPKRDFPPASTTIGFTTTGWPA